MNQIIFGFALLRTSQYFELSFKLIDDDPNLAINRINIFWINMNAGYLLGRLFEVQNLN